MIAKWQTSLDTVNVTPAFVCVTSHQPLKLSFSRGSSSKENFKLSSHFAKGSTASTATSSPKSARHMTLERYERHSLSLSPASLMQPFNKSQVTHGAQAWGHMLRQADLSHKVTDTIPQGVVAHREQVNKKCYSISHWTQQICEPNEPPAIRSRWLRPLHAVQAQFTLPLRLKSHSF